MINNNHGGKNDDGWTDDLNKWDKKREKGKGNNVTGRKFFLELLYFSAVFFFCGAFLVICLKSFVSFLLGIDIALGVVCLAVFIITMPIIVKRSQNRYQKLWLWAAINAFIVLMLLFCSASVRGIF